MVLCGIQQRFSEKDVNSMSPRPKLDDPKVNQYRLLLNKQELAKLEFCCHVLNMRKSKVLMEGLQIMYEKAQQK